MAEATFQNSLMREIVEIKNVVIGMKREIDFIKDKFDDRFLSEDDKRAIDETLDAEEKEQKTGKVESRRSGYRLSLVFTVSLPFV